MNRPAIILTSKFTTSAGQKDFAKYLGYMARKEALEEKKFLTDKEKKEWERINKNAKKLINQNEFLTHIKKEEDSKREKEAEDIMKKRSFYEMSDFDFDKYLGYMVRRGALLEKKANEGLTQKEKKEMETITKAAKHLGEVRPTKEKYLDGVYTVNQDDVRLKDLGAIRFNMRKAHEKNSILWEDVVSFDNEFLKKKGILNTSTATLDEDVIKRATRKMQDVFQKEMDPPLNDIFWVASIHRNTDNIHIHIATMELNPQRKMIERFGKLQPKGRRKQKVIDHMKSAFANEVFGSVELTKELSKERQRIRRAVQSELSNKIVKSEFQKKLNNLMIGLPKNKALWQYNRLNAEQKNTLDELVDYMLKDNKDYANWKKGIKQMQEDREALYGKSKRNNKDYAENQMHGKFGLYARNGNALLSDLKELDKKANSTGAKVIRMGKDYDSTDFIQSVLKQIKNETIKENGRMGQGVSREKKHKINFRLPQARLPLSKKQIHKIKTRQEMVFEKAHVSYEKRKALNNYKEMQESDINSQDQEI